MQYISSLISGVAIFCVGTGFSFYHGVTGLFNDEKHEDFMWAYIVLTGSLIFEAITLFLAIKSIRASAKEADMTFREYVLSGQDPCVNVVLFEDTAAVLGAAVAGVCIGNVFFKFDFSALSIRHKTLIRRHCPRSNSNLVQTELSLKIPKFTPILTRNLFLLSTEDIFVQQLD